MQSRFSRSFVGAAFALLSVAGAGEARAESASCAGTVVNLSCDSVRPAGGVARCDPGEHVFALEVDGRRGVQPLVLAGGPPSIERLRSGAFTGRQVRVVGSCPPSGAIRVEDVVPLG